MTSYLAVGEHLTAKCYVEEIISNSVDESSLLRLDPDEKLKLVEQDSIILHSTLSSPKTILEKPTNSYVDSLHENSRNRRGLLTVLNDEVIVFGNTKLTNLENITVNRDPDSESEPANKKYVDT